MRVDVAAIEAELARLQRELTSTEVRTSLFNLVVWSRDARRMMADAALNYLLGKRAARVIHIVSDDAPTSSIDVSARCFVDAERKGVCFQEIVITNGADGAGGAPGSWIPLLIRDVPTFVFWLDSICDRTDAFGHAHAQAHKVVIDSEHSVALGDDAGALLELLAAIAAEQRVPLGDFSWRRLRPYQRLTASIFDPDELRPMLREIAGIEVAGLPEFTSRLFALWMAERLGWRTVALERGESRFVDSRGRGIVARHRPTAEGCSTSIRITLTDGRSLDVSDNDTGCADVEFPDGQTDHRVFRVPTNGEILLEEVDSVYPDELYGSVLDQADRLV